MSGRKYTAGSGYRYGFNGKENDNDVKGEGNQQDYGMRIYDPRLGRFLSVDPLTKSYPTLTPYQYASNRPLDGIDIDGLEWGCYWLFRSAGTKPAQKPTTQQSTNSSQSSTQNVEAVRQLKNVANNSRIPILGGFLANLIPENSTGNKIAGVINGTGEFVTQAAEGIKNIVTKPGPTLKSMVTAPLMPTDPRMQKAAWDLSVQRAEQAQLYGQDFANYSYWTKTTLEVGSLLTPGLKTPVSAGNLPNRLARVIPEEVAGGSSLGNVGAVDVFVVNASELKGLNTSQQVAQKLTMLDESGNFVKGPFRIIEFDTPAAGLAQPFNRSNPGFVNGGKTAGGATEYVLPNKNISELKNVTQKTIQ